MMTGLAGAAPGRLGRCCTCELSDPAPELSAAREESGMCEATDDVERVTHRIDHTPEHRDAVDPSPSKPNRYEDEGRQRAARTARTIVATVIIGIPNMRKAPPPMLAPPVIAVITRNPIPNIRPINTDPKTKRS